MSEFSFSEAVTHIFQIRKNGEILVHCNSHKFSSPENQIQDVSRNAKFSPAPCNWTTFLLLLAAVILVCVYKDFNS